MNVFLSYAARDERIARVIRADLEQAGFRVWDPVMDVVPGGNWALEEGKALKDAEAMVVLISPAALTAEHVTREIEYALGELRFKGRLVPVIVRPVKDIPWILETLKVLRIDADPERGSRRVVEELKRIHAAA